MGYIGAHGVAALHRYKYSGVDHSYLAKYVLQPFWSRFVNLFPLWMPPNMITLTGFMFLLVSALLGYIYSPQLDSPPPRWVHFAHGLLLLLYQTFDAVDGKQARRTSSSSPLGELFDHGCDALACTFEALAFGSTAMCGRSTFWFWLISAVTFYGATWEHYFTNTLILPVVNGPTEGLMIIYVCHFFTAIVGAEWWAQQFGKSLPFLNWLPFIAGAPSLKPLLVYHRHNKTTPNQQSEPPRSPQDHSLAVDPVLEHEPEPALLQSGSCVRKPPEKYGFSPPLPLTANLASIPIPFSYKQAMERDCWQKAIKTELLALEEIQTWDVVPCPPSVKPLGSKFVFTIKLRSDGSIERHKARLIVLGNKQEYGLDYEETFAPVAKMTFVCTILAIAASQLWPLHQMDVKSAFFHGDLKEEVQIKLLTGMPTSSSNTVCKLKCSLYGLKQAPRVWFEKFRSTLLGFSYTQSQYDSSLFLRKTSHGVVVLLVYVDEIVVTGSGPEAISTIKQLLNSAFHMKELGQLTYFLGLEVHYQPKGIFINQHKYIQDLLPVLKLFGCVVFLVKRANLVENARKKTRSLSRPLNQSIAPCLLPALKLLGCVVFLQSLVFLKHNQHHYMLITQVLYQLQQIQCTMSAQST